MIPANPPLSRSRIRKFLPFLNWTGKLRDRKTLRADLLAGITLGLVIVPHSMACAQLAGLPVQHGLYAGFLPVILAALFGSAPLMNSGPLALVSLMTAAALAPLSLTSPLECAQYAMALALMVGVFQIALGLLRLGFIVDFLSHPVVLGFTNGAALIIATSQLDDLFGVTVAKAPHHYQTVFRTVSVAASGAHGWTVGMAALALVIIIAIKRIAPKAPAMLIAVALTTLLSWLGGYAQAGGRVVGDIPAGLPRYGLPKVDPARAFEGLAPSAIAIALIGFSVSKALAMQTRQRLDPNRCRFGTRLGGRVLQRPRQHFTP